MKEEVDYRDARTLIPWYSLRLLSGCRVRQPLPRGKLRPGLQEAVRLLQRRRLRPRQRPVSLPSGIPGEKGDQNHEYR